MKANRRLECNLLTTGGKKNRTGTKFKLKANRQESITKATNKIKKRKSEALNISMNKVWQSMKATHRSLNTAGNKEVSGSR